MMTMMLGRGDPQYCSMPLSANWPARKNEQQDTNGIFPEPTYSRTKVCGTGLQIRYTRLRLQSI